MCSNDRLQCGILHKNLSKKREPTDPEAKFDTKTTETDSVNLDVSRGIDEDLIIMGVIKQRGDC